MNVAIRVSVVFTLGILTAGTALGEINIDLASNAAFTQLGSE